MNNQHNQYFENSKPCPYQSNNPTGKQHTTSICPLPYWMNQKYNNNQYPQQNYNQVYQNYSNQDQINPKKLQPWQSQQIKCQQIQKSDDCGDLNKYQCDKCQCACCLQAQNQKNLTLQNYQNQIQELSNQIFAQENQLLQQKRNFEQQQEKDQRNQMYNTLLKEQNEYQLKQLDEEIKILKRENHLQNKYLEEIKSKCGQLERQNQELNILLMSKENMLIELQSEFRKKKNQYGTLEVEKLQHNLNQLLCQANEEKSDRSLNNQKKNNFDWNFLNQLTSLHQFGCPQCSTILNSSIQNFLVENFKEIQNKKRVENLESIKNNLFLNYKVKFCTTNNCTFFCIWQPNLSISYNQGYCQLCSKNTIFSEQELLHQ